MLMRIIAGKFKGHKLVSFDEDHIRPTTDRVKESLFNIIAAHVDGARCLDLFSGTGSLGLEAISRGASFVDMVEVNRRSIAIIEKNIRNLKIEEGIEIIKGDAVEYVKKYAGKAYDLVFIDPPFPAKVCLATLEALERSRAADENTVIMIEHSRHEPLPDSVGTLTRVDTRKYGDKLLAIYRKGN